MNETLPTTIESIVRRMTEYMQLPCTVTIAGAPDALTVDIRTEGDAKVLIGKNGQNLQALEHVLRMMLTRQAYATPVSLDINDYRKEKTTQLLEAVRTVAGRVRDTRKSEALHPMTSYERRLVHTELAGWSDLSTESIGQDPQRRVIIKPL